MTPLSQTFADAPRWFPAMWIVGAAWAVVFVGASIVIRARRGKPLFRPQLAGVRFAEGWRSGRSHRNLLTRIGGARNCLWVAVTADELRVGPHFPFSLGFLPEVYGLEQCVRGGDLIAVDARGPSAWGFDGPVLVRFRRPDGGEETFEMSVRDAAGFRRALEAIRT